MVVNRYRPPASVRARPKPVKFGSSCSSARASSGFAWRPAAFACQISTTASSQDAPSPSSTWPSTTIFSPRAPPRVRSLHSGRSRAKWKKGPTVCEGVPRLLAISAPERRRIAPAQHDVEAIAERIFGLAQIRLEPGDEPLAGRLVRHAIEDGIQREQRIAGKGHLGDQPRRIGGPEERAMDGRGPPRIVRVPPGIRAGLAGDAPVFA